MFCLTKHSVARQGRAVEISLPGLTKAAAALEWIYTVNVTERPLNEARGVIVVILLPDMPEKYYLTKKGFEKIERDYRALQKSRQRKVKEELPEVWEISEASAEYLTYQEDMALLEVRLAEYDKILKNVEVITSPSKDKRGMVFLGATVTLEEEPGGKINEYTVLGTLEANPMEGKISSESPVGRELLGKRVGEEVVIRSPIHVNYRIKKIAYRLT